MIGSFHSAQESGGPRRRAAAPYGAVSASVGDRRAALTAG